MAMTGTIKLSPLEYAIKSGHPLYLQIWEHNLLGRLLYQIQLNKCNPKIANGRVTFDVPPLTFDITATIEVWIAAENPKGQFAEVERMSLTNTNMTGGGVLNICQFYIALSD